MQDALLHSRIPKAFSLQDALLHSKIPKAFNLFFELALSTRHIIPTTLHRC
jgi:hypothetical protein